MSINQQQGGMQSTNFMIHAIDISVIQAFFMIINTASIEIASNSFLHIEVGNYWENTIF